MDPRRAQHPDPAVPGRTGGAPRPEDQRRGGHGRTRRPGEALRRGEPYEDWLLVFDNAESPESVRGYFPAGGTGNILVTSRNPQWSHVARPLEVDVFARTESVQLLRRRGPELTGAEADRLADALGDLPLAVEQAAAWLAETGMTADEYLRLFDEKRIELLDETESPDYNAPVIAVWNVSLDQLEAKNPAALQLLQVCSFCAPEPIPRRLFNRLRDRSIAPELDTALRDPIKQAQAIREIGRYSLARMDHRANSVQMHRLVQMALQARMTDEEQERMRRGAHQLLVANDPEDPENAGEWDRYGELTPHVMASDALHSEDPWVRALIINEVKYLCRWGDYETGSDLAGRAYGIWKERFGADDVQSLGVAKWLSVLNFSRGRYQDAARLNTEVLEAYRRTVGEDHQDTLDALGNVAIDYRVQGEFGTALELSESVHERYLRINGEDDPETLRAAHNVGVSLRLAGLFERARRLDEETWNHKVRMFGVDHAVSLVTWLGLIVDIRELGDYHQALTYRGAARAQPLPCGSGTSDSRPVDRAAALSGRSRTRIAHACRVRRRQPSYSASVSRVGRCACPPTGGRPRSSSATSSRCPSHSARSRRSPDQPGADAAGSRGTRTSPIRSPPGPPRTSAVSPWGTSARPRPGSRTVPSSTGTSARKVRPARPAAAAASRCRPPNSAQYGARPAAVTPAGRGPVAGSARRASATQIPVCGSRITRRTRSGSARWARASRSQADPAAGSRPAASAAGPPRSSRIRNSSSRLLYSAASSSAAAGALSPAELSAVEQVGDSRWCLGATSGSASLAACHGAEGALDVVQQRGDGRPQCRVIEGGQVVDRRVVEVGEPGPGVEGDFPRRRFGIHGGMVSYTLAGRFSNDRPGRCVAGPAPHVLARPDAPIGCPVDERRRRYGGCVTVRAW
ncbi:FxSxx-COOH system tetratricopeptide repeat protein [Streptomyces sp. NPDC001508]|uniref:FxSxx-COOH system tetratricopeptide repeat protein n=1 Tax=Streptomyces sp. NPDC001508 TaxID=3154656 RepID=UPI003328D009